MTKTFFALIVGAVLAHSAAVPKPAIQINTFEDTFALYALDAQVRHKYHRASAFFAELHKKTAKSEYLYQSLKMLEHANDTKTLAKMTAEALAKSPNDEILKRFEVIALIKGGDFAQASQKAFLLTQNNPKAPDHLLYAEARLKLADYEGALGALKKAYAMGFDHNTAERIALIEYAHLGRKAEAVKFLKEHIGTQGNSVVIGKRLASFYGDGGALGDAAAMYEQVYDAFGDAASAEEALKIYLFLKDYAKMTALLERSHLNDSMLLDLYVQARAFDKASALAMTLYEDQDNPLFLAQSAVYRYEGSVDRNDPALVTDVVAKLKKAADDIEEPLYLNYLGYLMIDHDVNVSEGMGYVRRALEKQPDSPFYIDSLAWGHYKRGECAEALRLIKQVESMIGTDEQEVRDHLKAIEACKPKEKTK